MATQNKLTHLLLLFLYVYPINCTNCGNKEATSFSDKTLIAKAKDISVCISDAAAKLEYVAVSNGFIKDTEILDSFKCTGDTNEVCFQMSEHFYYVLISKTGSKDTMMVINDELYTQMKTDGIQKKNVYYTNEFECFTGVVEDLEQFKKMEKDMIGKVYYTSNKDGYCSLFQNPTKSSHAFTINGNSIEILVKSRSLQSSEVLKYIPDCLANEEFDQETVNKLIVALGDKKDKFCVDSTQHTIDRLIRKSETEHRKLLNEYCKKIEGNKFCLKTQDDFLFATFHRVNADRKMLIMSHGTAAASFYTTDSTQSQTFTVEKLACSDSSKHTSKMALVLGYYDKDSMKVCVYSVELISTGTTTFGIAPEITFTHNGCSTPITTGLTKESIIKVDGNPEAKCIPKRNSIVEHLYKTGFLYDKFVQLDTLLCSTKQPKKECYSLIAEANYAIISNELDSSKTLIHRNDLINSNHAITYVYDETYFKDEIVCVAKSQVLNWQSIITKKYVVFDANKACFAVDLMTASETINIGPIFGCPSRSLKIDQSQAKPAGTDRSEPNKCQKVIDLKTKSEAISLQYIADENEFTKCLELTCYKIDYSFEIKSDGGNSLVHKIKECTSDTAPCTNGNTNKFVVYLVRDPITEKRNLHMTMNEVPALSYTEKTFIYGSKYYMDDVVCFPDAKIEGEEIERTFPIKKNAYSCVIVKDLEKDVSLRVETFQNCNRVVQLIHDQKSPYETGKEPEAICSSVFTDDSKTFHKLDKTILWQCISLTCSKITYISDFSQSQNAVLYTLQICDLGDGTNPCSSHNGMESLVKISSARFIDQKFLYSKDLDIEISESQFYEKYYDANDIVCFPLTYVSDSEQNKIPNSYFKGTKSLCVIPKELSAIQTIDLTIRTGCTRTITLDKDISSAAKSAANVVNPNCVQFISKSGVFHPFITKNLVDVKSCITSMCLKKISMINSDESVTDCTETDCNLETQGIKYFKVESQYNQRIFYVIPTGSDGSIAITFGISSFYKSQYFLSDIVCINSAKLNDPEISDTAGIITTSDGQTCYVVNELTKERTVSVKLTQTCESNIIFKKGTKTQTENRELTNRDTVCSKFINQVDDQSVPLELASATLKSCFTQLCLEPIYLAKRQIAKDYIGNLIYCTNHREQCDQAVTGYDYAKIKNPYNNQEFYVKNPDIKGDNILENSFVPSPLYKNEIICFKDTELVVETPYTLSNSYSLDTRKCILVGELSKNSKIQLKTISGCRRTIETNIEISPTEAFKRDVDHTICQNLLVPGSERENIHYMPLDKLKNCLLHTCSTVLSKVEIPDKNKPYTQSKITNCDGKQPITSCFKDDHVYDFLKVHNAYMNGHKYFRTYGSDELENYIQKRFVFYDSKYYNDDIVCFYDKSLQAITEANRITHKNAIFKDENRLCILLNYLNAELDVQYVITSTCNVPIKMSNSVRPTLAPGETAVQSSRQSCPDFFTKQINAQTSPKYDIDKLKQCLTNTCSRVEQFVKLESNTDNYQDKKIKVCASTESNDDCLTDVVYFEALKVKSPFVSGHVYVQSEVVKTSDLQYYRRKIYRDKYYADEIVCIHQDDFVYSSLVSASEGVFINGNVMCFVPKEYPQNVNIQIRMFGKCLKTISLIPNTLSTSVSSTATDICQPLFTTTANPPSKMKLENLRQCLVKTCSQLVYYLTLTQNDDTHVKTFHKCETKTGDASCIAGESIYFLAKITNSAVSGPIYILSDESSVLAEKALENVFYKKQYFKDEVVCGERTKMTIQNGGDFFIPIGDVKYGCIVVKDLDAEKTLTIQLKDNCNKQIKLTPITSRNNLENQDDTDCQIFYTDSSDPITILTVSVTNIRKCITHTCSKVEKYVKTSDAIPKTASDVSSCSNIHGNNECIDVSKKFELIKISNAYRKNPFFLRSYDSDIGVNAAKISFDKSVYVAATDFKCFLSKSILNLGEVSLEEGVLMTPVQTCVFVPDLKKEIQIKLKVGDNCYREIYFFVPGRDIAQHTSHVKDTSCRKYYKSETSDKNLVISKKSDFLSCAAHTCSSFKLMQQSESKKLCPALGGKPCNPENNYMSAIVVSPFEEATFLTMSEEAKTDWDNIFNDVYQYHLLFGSDEIPCFKTDIITAMGTKSIKYFDDAKNIYCYKFDSNDKEYLISINPTKNPELKLLETDGSKIQDFEVSKVKIDIYGLTKETNSMNKVFEFESIFDASKIDEYFTDLSDLEDCASESKVTKPTDAPISNSTFEKGYAFTITENSIFKKRFVFFYQSEKGCVGYYKNDETDISKTKNMGEWNDIEMNHYECLLISNDYPIMVINFKTDTKTMIRGENPNCISIQQLNQSCKYIYEFTNHITICLKNRKERSDGNGPNGKSAIYVMVKKESCYYHKITLWDKVGFCQVKSKELTISLFEWKTEKESKPFILSAKAASIGSGFSIGFGALAIIVAVVFIVGRLSNSSRNKYSTESQC